MATPLDLEEQEQLDQLKAFWKKYGSLVTWILIAVLAAFAAWNGWNWYQRDQAIKASALFDEMDKAAMSADAERVSLAFTDMKSRYPGAAFTQQAGLLAAKVQFDKGQVDAAVATLSWVRDNASEQEYRAVARLRLAGIFFDQKKFDEAMTQLDPALDTASPDFSALIHDRRGDVLAAQGKKDEAAAAYRKAWDAMDAKVEYRRLIEAKLTALAAPPPEPLASTAASGAKP